MNKSGDIINDDQGTLESEIEAFIKQLPLWNQYLAVNIRNGKSINDFEIDNAFNLLLEEINLKEKGDEEKISVSQQLIQSKNKTKYTLKKLEKVTGVNALELNQIIEFDDNITIIFGSNGAGKSGYTRLFKKSFYSKAKEDILKNINDNSPTLNISAKFEFRTDNNNISLVYPDNQENQAFETFSVFDGKSVDSYLNKKNEFEFRPAGLNFFAELTEAIRKLEAKVNQTVETKKNNYDLSILFENESEIKTFVKQISAKTEFSEYKKYSPYTEADKKERESLELQFGELSLKTKNKENEIGELRKRIEHLNTLQSKIDQINKKFDSGSLKNIKDSLNSYAEKENIVKKQGIESLHSNEVKSIGSKEWKNFIESAEKFAILQQSNGNYPQENDSCILCHQPLSTEALALIKNYWIFIHSVAESELKLAQENVNHLLEDYTNLNLDLIPSDSILRDWLQKKYPIFLSNVSSELKEIDDKRKIILKSLSNKLNIELLIGKVNSDEIKNYISDIEKNILDFGNDELNNQLSEIKEKKKYLHHKELFNIHFEKIIQVIENLKWIEKISKINLGKRSITEKEKTLSLKFFSQKYIDTFNEICKKLRGDFGITINHTGSGGISYRQLSLKGNSPSSILSEGEQKVIALADFLAEMSLSEINNGIIFDDPVNSLDDDRKEIIAGYLVRESKLKQIIIFTHDRPFFHHLSNHIEKLNISSNVHMIEKIGKVFLNNSPHLEKKYANTLLAKNNFKESKLANPEERSRLLRDGFAVLASCYEYFVKNNILKNIIEPFNKHIKVGTLRQIRMDDNFTDKYLNGYSKVCDLKEGHLPNDYYSYSEINPDILESEIKFFEVLQNEYKQLVNGTLPITRSTT